MDQDYKARKEAFVSNHLGGGIDEINAVTLVASVSPWAFFRRLTEANNGCVIITDLGVTVVGAPVSPLLFHTVFRSGSRYGLSPQCRRHSVCDYALLLVSAPVEYSPCFARHSPVPHSKADTRLPESEATTTDGAETRWLLFQVEWFGPFPRPSISYYIPSGYDGRDLCCNPGGRFSGFSTTVRQS
jgi:hypothetical protein